jgi:hypothetical protein
MPAHWTSLPSLEPFAIAGEGATADARAPAGRTSPHPKEHPWPK